MTYHIGYRQYDIRYRCFFPKVVLYTNKLLKYIWRFLALQGCQMIENMGLISNKYFMSMSCTPLNYVSRFHVGEESYRPMTIIYYTKGPFQLTSHQYYAERKDGFEPFFSTLHNNFTIQQRYFFSKVQLCYRVNLYSKKVRSSLLAKGLRLIHGNIALNIGKY